jgi:hypothetical protein
MSVQKIGNWSESLNLKMYATCSFETSVSAYKGIRYNSEEHKLRNMYKIYVIIIQKSSNLETCCTKI